MPEKSSWSGLPTWQVLDTEFGSGQVFFETCDEWLLNPVRSGVLNYVAFCAQPCSKESLHKGTSHAICVIRQALSDQWHGLLPGYHRFLLQQGKVILTLCIGDKLSLIRSQRFLADAIEFCEPSLDSQDLVWLAKGLSRCSKRGTHIRIHPKSQSGSHRLASVLTTHGFDMFTDEGSSSHSNLSTITGRYQPNWQFTHSPKFTTPLPVQRCAVIGAGLAGASVAASLARRGWEVTVLEKGDTHAAGASGLPVGLVNPHVTSDDSALSQLSRAGVRLTLQQANELLTKHTDWSPTGVFEKQVGGTPKLPHNWTAVGNEWSEFKTTSDENETGTCGVWHHQGAWLKPERLIHAWLNSPQVTLKTNAMVANLSFQNGVWLVLDAHGTKLMEAERVVFANACGAFGLLKRLNAQGDPHFQHVQHIPPAFGMKGLLSWSTHESDQTQFKAFPINGSGSVIANIPQTVGSAWFMGSSYQPESQAERTDQDNHLANFAHLQELSPSLARHFKHHFESGKMSAWKGTRCVMKDRMPVVGALDASAQPSVWICAGLGSRGLSFSVLCAELLAAQFGAEPWPISSQLAKSLLLLRG